MMPQPVRWFSPPLTSQNLSSGTTESSSPILRRVRGMKTPSPSSRRVVSRREPETGNFSPESTLTRGQFIVLLLRAHGIAPAENSSENFADAGNTWYTGYLAAAKETGHIQRDRQQSVCSRSRNQQAGNVYSAPPDDQHSLACCLMARRAAAFPISQTRPRSRATPERQ